MTDPSKLVYLEEIDSEIYNGKFCFPDLTENETAKIALANSENKPTYFQYGFPVCARIRSLHDSKAGLILSDPIDMRSILFMTSSDQAGIASSAAVDMRDGFVVDNDGLANLVKNGDRISIGEPKNEDGKYPCDPDTKFLEYICDKRVSSRLSILVRLYDSVKYFDVKNEAEYRVINDPAYASMTVKEALTKAREKAKIELYGTDAHEFEMEIRILFSSNPIFANKLLVGICERNDDTPYWPRSTCNMFPEIEDRLMYGVKYTRMSSNNAVNAVVHQLFDYSNIGPLLDKIGVNDRKFVESSLKSSILKYVQTCI
jgi:hypothetical protein